MPDPSAGEIGGIFAGLVALLVATAKGFGWLLGWDERRKQSRYDKLQAWQGELERREKDIDDKQARYFKEIEEKFEVVQKQNSALMGAYQLIVGALRIKDPTNPAIGQADELLRTAFPVDPITPPHLAGLLNQIP